MGEKKQIQISVKDKIACLVDEEQFLVCGNNDYEVVFDFDSDWEGISAKTAVFVYGNTPVHQPFVGNVCKGIEIKNATLCAIGVFAGNIKTTTGATIECRQSIRDLGGVPKPPSKEVYDEIMELLDKAISGGGGGSVDLTEIEEKIENLDTSVKQNTESLETKLDKTTEANKVYGTDGNGEQTAYSVDELAKNKVDKPTATSTSNRIYGVKPNATEPSFYIGAYQPIAGAVMLYGADGASIVATPTDASNPKTATNVEYVKGLVNPIAEKQTDLEERVTDLESLTLTYIEDGSTAYEKSVPANVGSKALIKAIGGATKRVFGKNLVNPADIQMPEEVDSYTINSDGTVTYTINNSPIGFAFISLSGLPAGKYYFYVEGTHLDVNGKEIWNFWGMDYGQFIEMYVMSDFDNDLNEYLPTTRTLKAMLWRDESVTTDTLEIVEAPEGTVFEPYHEPYLEDTEVERIESIGANLIPFPYKDKDKTQNGITYTVLADGGIKRVGTSTGYGSYVFSSNMHFEDGKTYYKSPDTLQIAYKKADGSMGYVSGEKFTWKAEYTLHSVYIQINSGVTVDEIIYPMINVGSTKIPYTPYKAEPIDAFVIPEAVKLKGVNDTYYDYIEVKDNKVLRHKVADEIVLNGTETWKSNGNYDSKNNYFLSIITTDKTKYVGGVVSSDKYDFFDLNSTNTEIGIDAYVSNGFGGFAVGIRPLNVLSYSSVSQFQNSLISNPITVRLALVNPEVEDITHLFTTTEIKLLIERGGVLRFVNKDKMPVPSSVWFTTRKE